MDKNLWIVFHLSGEGHSLTSAAYRDFLINERAMLRFRSSSVCLYLKDHFVPLSILNFRTDREPSRFTKGLLVWI